MRHYVGAFGGDRFPMDIGEVTVSRLDLCRVLTAFHERWDNKRLQCSVSFGIGTIDWLDPCGNLQDHIVYWRRPVFSDGACVVREAETRMTFGQFLEWVEDITGMKDCDNEDTS